MIQLDAAGIRRLLPVADAVDVLEGALAGGLDPEAAPARSITDVQSGQVLLMPAAVAAHVGVKVATVAPGNAGRGLPRVQGLYVLLDGATLAPLAVLDAIELTALRTPAISAVAVRHLAVPDARRLVVFGTGPQARGHVAAICAVRPIERVTVVGRSRLAEFAAECRRPGVEVDIRAVPATASGSGDAGKGPGAVAGADTGLAAVADTDAAARADPTTGPGAAAGNGPDAAAAAGPGAAAGAGAGEEAVDAGAGRGAVDAGAAGVVAAVAEADIVACCTTARTPLFPGELVPAHATVVAVGSHEPEAREVDDALVRRSTIVVESRTSALREAGDLIMPTRSGVIAEDDIDGNLADLVAGSVRIDPGRPRFFKSTGMAWEDLVVAAAVYERHRE
jgi:ornithine cyclodeaminase/alanine dehydrogenase-like protein (mu-crystallin family)